jgi:hypothetical protein
MVTWMPVNAYGAAENGGIALKVAAPQR